MDLRMPPELEAKLTRIAAETGRTADQAALDLLASSIDHEEPFRGEVEKIRLSTRLIREAQWLAACCALAIVFCWLAPDYGYSPVTFFTLAFWLLSGIVRGLISLLKRH